MRRSIPVFAVLLSLSFTTFPALAKAPLHDCDRLAGTPNDPEIVGPYVMFGDLDPDAAIPACQAAAETYPDDMRFVFQLARAQSKAERFDDWRANLIKAAEGGYGAAQSALGSAMVYGKNMDRNASNGVAWLKRADQSGNPIAGFHLGWMHIDGAGVPRDGDLAISWFKRSAQLGNPQAMFNLGTFYRDGEGVPSSHKEALKWFLLGAERGHPKAMLEVAILLDLGSGVEFDGPTAAKWYEQAAKHGIGLAANNLGSLYGSGGSGVGRDLAASYYWTRLGVKLGDDTAEGNLKFFKTKLTPDEINAIDAQIESFEPTPVRLEFRPMT